MNRIIVTLCILSAFVLASCDVRSETAKREMEKYASSTPTPMPTPTPEPSIDPAESVTVDTSVEGTTISVDGHEQKKSVSCPKFDRLMVNGDKNVLTVKGVCRQIMINGDDNELNLDAAAELVFNGSNNTVRYARYANGKRPVITENKTGNIIEKAASGDKAKR